MCICEAAWPNVTCFRDPHERWLDEIRALRDPGQTHEIRRLNLAGLTD